MVISVSSGKRIVVIGGVAAGLSAASKARKLRSDIEILVFEKSGHISYGACGLPYLISDLIKSPEDLVVLYPVPTSHMPPTMSNTMGTSLGQQPEVHVESGIDLYVDQSCQWF